VRIKAQISRRNVISIVVEYPFYFALKFRFRLFLERASKSIRRGDAMPDSSDQRGTQQCSVLRLALASGSLTIDFRNGPIGRAYGQLPYLTLSPVVPHKTAL